MYLRTGLMVAAVLALSACGGKAAPKPTPTVADVGRPPMAASIDAALAQQAFTPYAHIGQVDSDGLAPHETTAQLGIACMSAAGYPAYGGNLPGQSVRVGDGVVGTSPFGPYGYVGGPTGPAARGFNPALGQGVHSSTPVGQLPADEQTAALICAHIIGDFRDTQEQGSLAIVDSLSTTIGSDVQQDPQVIAATAAWSQCMAADGYQLADPDAAIHGGLRPVQGPAGTGTPAPPDPAAVALAQADARCTDRSDLDGIYFAVQAEYEQQVVAANRQQLVSAAQRYRVAYQQELAQMPQLLTTTPPLTTN